eukprot:517435-Pleurochrysis_carterae.AAC.1
MHMRSVHAHAQRACTCASRCVHVRTRGCATRGLAAQRPCDFEHTREGADGRLSAHVPVPSAFSASFASTYANASTATATATCPFLSASASACTLLASA